MKTSKLGVFFLFLFAAITCSRLVGAQDFPPHIPGPHEQMEHTQPDEDNLPPLSTSGKIMLAVKVLFSMLGLPALMFLLYRLLSGGGFFAEEFERVVARLSVIILYTLVAVFAHEIYNIKFLLYLSPVVAVITLATLWSSWFQRQYNLKIKEPEPGTWICGKCCAHNNEILMECHECGTHRPPPDDSTTPQDQTT